MEAQHIQHALWSSPLMPLALVITFVRASLGPPRNPKSLFAQVPVGQWELRMSYSFSFRPELSPLLPAHPEPRMILGGPDQPQAKHSTGDDKLTPAPMLSLSWAIKRIVKLNTKSTFSVD